MEAVEKGRLEYYLRLPYRMEIAQIPEDRGGGYMACLPQFGRMALVGDGETITEAIASLEESKKTLFEEYLEGGVEIPEPDSFEESYSGKFLARIPKYLHRELAIRAKQNDISLNQLVTSLLSGALMEKKLVSALEDLRLQVNLIREDLCRLHYEMEPGALPPRRLYSFAADDIDEAA